MWIKICANTSLADALLASELGADALGFVFAPSSRNVTPQQIAEITPHLPASIEKIGVFTSTDPAEIADAARTAHLTGVQLHSAYEPTLVATLAARLPGIRIIQTTHRNVAGSASQDDLELRQAPHISAVLVDSRTAGASGGTGISFDWEAARDSLAAFAPRNLIVAGGLDSDNVRQAIAILHPWGVDVASGVESSPGNKDARKLADFLRQARMVTS